MQATTMTLTTSAVTLSQVTRCDSETWVVVDFQIDESAGVETGAHLHEKAAGSAETEDRPGRYSIPGI